MKYCPVHKTYHHTCNNPNHAHNHKKHFHVRKTFLSKVHIIIFGLSIALLIIISLISLILAITNVNYPRIFLFGIMIYIATFICGGGVIGSYGPIDNQELNYIYMRKCVSIAMLIICIILFPFFLLAIIPSPSFVILLFDFSSFSSPIIIFLKSERRRSRYMQIIRRYLQIKYRQKQKIGQLTI